MIGETINERYKITAELGQGGMGTVYRAHDEALNRDVAVKLMSNTKLGTEGRARLMAEAQTIAQLNHTNIVTVHDVGEYDSLPFIVMELVEGKTLRDNLPAGWEDIISVAKQITSALQHAHEHDVIHRDVKPENVAIDPDGTVKLMDFGIAHSVSSRITTDGMVIGTVYYMSPEQAMGKRVDVRSDLYSLGVMLYEFSTGEVPFEDDDPIAVISQHINAPIIPARAKNSDIPPGLDALISRLLEKEPDDRPATAEDVLKTLSDPMFLDTGAYPVEELSLLDRIVRGRLIGRKAEFEEARALWRKAVSGQGQLLLISGEPGVGKTRLMREIATHAEVTGGRVLIGESFAEGNPPYGAFGQIVHAALDPASRNGIELADFVLADLLSIAPELRQHYPDIPPNASLEPEAERQRLFENVTTFSADLSQQAPLLIVVDDVHWANSGTLFLLRHLARRTKNLPIMLVATYREVELIGTHPLNEMLMELNRQRIGTRVKLSRLDVGNTRHLLEAIFSEDVSQEFADAIFRETEGNPFFIEEVCKSLVESGVLYFEEGEWHRPDLDEIEIPQSIQVAIEARLSILDEEVIDMLRMAATLGREFQYNTLLKAIDSTEDELVNALETAEEAQLLSEVSGKAGGVFSFAHALIPAALISSLSGLRRRRLHRQALAAEEELHPEDYASLAHHAAESGNDKKSLDYGRKAGDAAAALYAWDEAQFQYKRAIEAAEELKMEERLSQLHEALGKAYASQGLHILAAETIQFAVQHSSDQPRIIELKAFMGSRYTSVGDPRGLPLLEEARKELNPKTQASVLADTISRIGRHHHLAGHHQKALDAFDEAQKILDKIDDPTVQGFIYVSTAAALQHLAQYEESNKWAHKSIELGQQEENPFGEAVGIEYLGENADNMGRWQDALDFGERELKIARQIGDQGRIGWSRFYTSAAYHGLGLLTEAERESREYQGIAELSGDMRMELVSYGQLTRILTDMGRFEEAENYGLRAIEQANQVDQIFMIGVSKLSMTTYHVHRENWADAITLLDSVAASLAGSDGRWFPLFAQPMLAEAYYGLGDVEKAQMLAEGSYQASLESGSLKVQTDSQRILAQVSYSQEKYHQALQQVTVAIKVAEQENTRLSLGRAYLWKAKILAAQGDTKAAREAAAEAVELFEFCGAQPDLERARAFVKSII